MANFDAASRTKIESVHTASRMIQIVYSVYAQAKSAQALIQLYVANTDSTFNAAVNAMTTASERTELNAVLTQISAFVTDMENNHANLVSGG